MKEKGYTVRSLATALGLHFTLIDRYRNGLNVNEETANKIKELLTSNH